MKLIPLNIFQTWHTKHIEPEMEKAVNQLKVEIQHFIGIESPVLNYVPEFLSDKNSVIQIQGNHENVLEIEDNLLEFINSVVKLQKIILK